MTKMAWSPDTPARPGSNIYENHGAETMIVTVRVSRTGDSGALRFSVPNEDSTWKQIELGGETETFTARVQQGRAISFHGDGACHFSLMVQPAAES